MLKLMTSSVVPRVTQITKSKILLEILPQFSSNLGTNNVYQSAHKMAAHKMTVAMATVLLPDQGHQGCGELVFPSFCLNQTSFTLNELIRRPTATWVLCLF